MNRRINARLAQLERAIAARAAPSIRVWRQDLDGPLFTGPDGQRMARDEIRATYPDDTNIWVVWDSQPARLQPPPDRAHGPARSGGFLLLDLPPYFMLK